MPVSASRRALLRGDLRARNTPLRPPWSGGDARFAALCDRCGECLPACPTRVLVIGDGGFPAIDFRRGECTFCARCADACPTRALDPDEAARWEVAAEIGEGCLARRGIECRTCGEQCDSGAIRFRLRPGGVAQPQLDAGACNGCGACVRPCPVAALGVRPRAPSRADATV